MLILIGGGVGSLLRYWMSISAHQLFGRTFPYGTLMVNVVGCFLMGFLSILLLERLQHHTEFLKALLLIGFLGGFTTFSSFSFETLNMLENGELLRAVTNIFCSFGLCLIAVSVGAILAKQI